MNIRESTNLPLNPGFYSNPPHYAAQGFYYYHQQYDTITQTSLFSPTSSIRYCFENPEHYEAVTSKEVTKYVQLSPMSPLASQIIPTHPYYSFNNNYETESETSDNTISSPEKPIQMNFDPSQGLTFYSEDSNTFENDGSNEQANFYINQEQKSVAAEKQLKIDLNCENIDRKDDQNYSSPTTGDSTGEKTLT